MFSIKSLVITTKEKIEHSFLISMCFIHFFKILIFLTVERAFFKFLNNFSTKCSTHDFVNLKTFNTQLFVIKNLVIATTIYLKTAF